MIRVRIVIQSLKDVQENKPLLEDVKIENISECDELIIGILEHGMESGNTSLSFMLRTGDKVQIGQMSLAQFEALGHAIRGAEERFLNEREDG